MTSADPVNLDTSVLLNYVYVCLPGEIEADRGSKDLLEESDRTRVIGGKVKGEFTNRCDRRHELYVDLLDWLRDNPEESIYEYDIASRDIPSSPSDRDHIRLSIQFEWDGESRRKQLSDFRRITQDITTLMREILRSCLGEIYPQFSNRDLKSELQGHDLKHDKDVVVDAVEINQRDSIDLLVSTDSDITSEEQIGAINEAICEVEGSDLSLQIATPSEA